MDRGEADEWANAPLLLGSTSQPALGLSNQRQVNLKPP